MRLVAALFVMLLLQTACTHAPPWKAGDRVGDVYEIRLLNVSETSDDKGSSSSSRSSTMLVERVTALREHGVELEFDLPEGTSEEERASVWQFPARVLASSEHPLQLLNSSELEARLDSWLERGGIPESACGRWIFTWNAFKIECDPYTVLETLALYNLRLDDIRVGALYSEPGAREPVPLRQQLVSSSGEIFVAEMEVDPQAVRRGRAESDVVVAEILQEPLALEAALEEWASREISGTITTTLETDAVGRVMKRTTVSNLVVVDEDGSQELQTSTLTVERRLGTP